ncbi:hypothetical protein [Confluentibacter sediminis]|uniref:hypothetical protein n=1 Tax=Confluentibacter sediminis TaxID=2219045 RepID=UPI0013A6ADD6|nr:hypothetical protein [Confluentibacter sediminis]
MNKLSNEIKETYNIKSIDIKMLRKDDIIISLTDSRFHNFSSEKKQALANQIGELVSKLRGDMTKINTGELLFINETNFIVGKTTESESFKMFE